MNGNEKKGNDRFEQKVHKGLERSYALAKNQKNELDVGSGQARIVIFSDHHRGVRDGADDFMRCEKAYSAALGYYLELGYTLIVLGDAEESGSAVLVRSLSRIAKRFFWKPRSRNRATTIEYTATTMTIGKKRQV